MEALKVCPLGVVPLKGTAEVRELPHPLDQAVFDDGPAIRGVWGDVRVQPERFPFHRPRVPLNKGGGGAAGGR